jgi:hypothetical protein
MAVGTETGAELFSCPLPSQPVFDGMIASGGDLFISLIDGTVRCLVTVHGAETRMTTKHTKYTKKKDAKQNGE